MRADDKTIQLPDGRVLGYNEYGDPHGLPVIFFHGAPGSRLYWLLAGDAAEKSYVRVIAFDRPGIGLSDPLPDRTISSIAHDVEALADSLGIERFAVLGHSAGGPYALATAAALSERVLAVGLVSCSGDLSIPELAKAPSRTIRAGLKAVAGAPAKVAFRIATPTQARRVVHQWVDVIISRVPSADTRVFAKRQTRKLVEEILVEALAQGAEGVREDLLLMMSPWDFKLRDVAAPVISWSGGDDTWAPPKIAQWLADQLPNVSIHPLPADGHFTILARRAPAVLGSLAEAVNALRLKEGPVRLGIIGTESTGKTTLAEMLGEALQMPVVHELTRERAAEKLEQGEHVWTEAEFVELVVDQADMIDHVVLENPDAPLVICDAEGASVAVWHAFEMGGVSNAVVSAAMDRLSDAYILTGTDVPWQSDGLRNSPHLRTDMHEAMTRFLQDSGKPWITVHGTPEQRREIAIEFLRTLRVIGE